MMFEIYQFIYACFYFLSIALLVDFKSRQADNLRKYKTNFENRHLVFLIFPTTFSLGNSMDFYVLNLNFNVVSSKKLQFFLIYDQKSIFFFFFFLGNFMLFTIIVLVQVSQKWGFSQIQAFLYCFDHEVHEIILFQRKNTYKMLA